MTTNLITLPKKSVLRYGTTAIACLREDIPVPPTGISLLVGLNGEGKTTFLRWLCDLLPDSPSPLPAGKTLYLPENLDWPGNLNYQQLRRALAPDVVTAEQWSFLLGLDPKKKYRLLSKGNRQKVRLLLTEAIAQQHKSEIICLDEPLSGLDYRTREVVWKGWRGDLDWSRAHRIVSMHPTDIPYNPDQVIAAARGGITVLPFSGRLSWDQIKTSLSA